MKVAIFGSSDPGGLDHILEYAPFDLVLCADGGLRFAKKLGLTPDLLVGDGDSGGVPEAGVPFFKLPTAKDVTDSEATLEKAAALSAQEVFFFCCTGGRLDHFLANVFLLERAAELGIRAVLVDPLNEIRYLNEGELTLKNDGRFTYISLLPIDRAVSGVDISDAAFPLSEAEMRRAKTFGVSNRMLGSETVVRVRKGALLVILSRDPA